ncbi:MAG: hypothetical protein CM15mV143_270 [Caudoviricetes sp.]|nr:MAG: hypothetical protein CM15mV143_270 [Caudoviricetes sp.]
MSQTTRGADKKGRLENGNFVEDTGYFFYIWEKIKSNGKGIITMKSTQKKKSKTWNSMILSRKDRVRRDVNPHHSRYRLKTTKESNHKILVWLGSRL